MFRSSAPRDNRRVPDACGMGRKECLHYTGSMKLLGKIVLVTGGNSGIGRGIVLRAAAEGARVAIGGHPHRHC